MVQLMPLPSHLLPHLDWRLVVVVVAVAVAVAVVVVVNISSYCEGIRQQSR